VLQIAIVIVTILLQSLLMDIIVSRMIVVVIPHGNKTKVINLLILVPMPIVQIFGLILILITIVDQHHNTVINNLGF
jgi:hypothetical protein